MRRRTSLDELQFGYSTRREGQEGGLVKTNVELGRKWQLVNYISFSQLDRDSSNLELLSGVVAELSSSVSIRCDYLRKRRYQVEVGEVDDRLNQQYRLETRLSLGDWRVRSYIAFRQHNQQQDYGGLFVSTVYNSAMAGRWELWLDLRRLNFDSNQLDYANVFVRTEQGIGSSIATAFKIAHRYSRSSRDTHETTVTLEVTAGI